MSDICYIPKDCYVFDVEIKVGDTDRLRDDGYKIQKTVTQLWFTKETPKEVAKHVITDRVNRMIDTLYEELEKENKMTQEQRVLNYIREHGSITSMQAFTDLKITRLSARIFNLRAQGHNIENVSHTYKNGQGTFTTYTEYVLREDVCPKSVG